MSIKKIKIKQRITEHDRKSFGGHIKLGREYEERAKFHKKYTWIYIKVDEFIIDWRV